MNFYILLFLSGFFASMTILTTIQIVNGIDEDQSYICKHKAHFDNGQNTDYTLVCTIMQDSELFTQKSSDKMYNQLENDLDTFEILETTTINGGSD